MFAYPKDDYNEILNVLVPIDSNQTRSQKQAFDYAIQKASLPIQWHSSSKWVDDCYLVIGKARLYQEDFVNAITTFKYVNARSESADTRHAALILLMRTFLETKEYNNFVLIKEYINKETVPFSEENTRDYHLVMAQYWRDREGYETSLQHLKYAVELVNRREQKARLYFLMGQMYQELGEEVLAHEYFTKTLKKHPSYELTFQADVNASATRPAGSSEEFKKTERYFYRLLDDDKNWEFRDKIYYEMARFALKSQEFERALGYLNESVQVSQANQVQKGRSYMLAAETYYAPLKEYEKSALYYDSALKIISPDFRDYGLFRDRAEILMELANHLRTIREQENKLKLSQLSEDERLELIRKEIEEEKEAIIRQETFRKMNKQKQERATVSSSVAQSGGGSGAGAGWYFYNPTATVNGSANFLRVWGGRPLEDNWRRSRKAIVFNRPNQNEDPMVAAGRAGKQQEAQEDLFASVASEEDRLSKIPQTEDQIDAAKLKVREGLYGAGKIFLYKLEEFPDAKSYLERMVAEYPDKELTPEGLYLLYTLCRQQKMCDPEPWKKQLIEQFPDSFYAKIILNPNYVAETNERDQQVEERYQRAFELYKTGQYAAAEDLLTEITRLFPETIYLDKVRMLHVMVLGRATGVQQYYVSLNKFIQEFPESNLLPLAKRLLSKISDADLKQAQQQPNEN